MGRASGQQPDRSRTIFFQQSDQGRGNQLRVTFPLDCVGGNLMGDIQEIIKDAKPVFCYAQATGESAVITAEFTTADRCSAVWKASQDMARTHELLAGVLGYERSSKDLLSELSGE